MSRFIKVMEWGHPDFYQGQGNIIFLNIDDIKKFSRVKDLNVSFNFEGYSDNPNLFDFRNPTEFIDTDGYRYFYPLDLNSNNEYETKPIHNRFEILDL